MIPLVGTFNNKALLDGAFANFRDISSAPVVTALLPRGRFWTTSWGRPRTTPASGRRAPTPPGSSTRSSATGTWPPGAGSSARPARRTTPTSVRFKGDKISKSVYYYIFSDAATLIFVNIFVRGFSEINDVKMVDFSIIQCLFSFVICRSTSSK